MTLVKYWQKTSFWSKVEKSFMYIGSTITGGLVITEVSKPLTIISIVITILGGLLGFWMADANSDGVVDLFEPDETHN